MKKTLSDLVNGVYTDEQRVKVKEIIANNEKHLMSYKILAVGVEDNIVNLSTEEVKDFYQVDDIGWLSEVDFVIANLITTLSKLKDKDVKTEYDSSVILDKSQPELEYLIKEVGEHLSN